jgi:hypothetical protein
MLDGAWEFGWLGSPLSFILANVRARGLLTYEVCSESNAPDKITSERFMVERLRKNIYFGDSYSLSESF